jgi:hypothetical protein
MRPVRGTLCRLELAACNRQVSSSYPVSLLRDSLRALLWLCPRVAPLRLYLLRRTVSRLICPRGRGTTESKVLADELELVVGWRQTRKPP